MNAPLHPDLGVSGAGKSQYCKWLAQRGYIYLDNDTIAQRISAGTANRLEQHWTPCESTESCVDDGERDSWWPDTIRAPQAVCGQNIDWVYAVNAGVYGAIGGVAGSVAGNLTVNSSARVTAALAIGAAISC